jgi:sigma-B regulation protein RsbU (phosphoserine phosphatase)
MVFPLIGTHIRLGREPDFGISLIDPLVSRQHASLVRRGNDVWVEDLGSTNGTLINGERLAEMRRLRGGDELCLGVTRMIFEPPSEADDTQRLPESASHLPAVKLDLLSLDAPAADPHPAQAASSEVAIGESLAHRQLMTLLEWSERLREMSSREAIAEELCAIALRGTGGSRAVALLRSPEETADLLPVVARHRHENPSPSLPISQALVRRAIVAGTAVLSTDPDDGLAGAEEARELLGSVIATPLFHQGALWGALVVDTVPGEASLAEEDRAFVASLCHQSAAALAALEARERAAERLRQNRELAIARELQERMLPTRLPELPEGWGWAAISEPARVVGGDYHDAWRLEDGRWAVALGDVSGKGVPAALLLAAMRAYLRAEASRPGAQAADVVTRLNHWALQEAPLNMYMSLCFGILDPAAHEFTYTNAGHPPPMWARPGVETRFLTRGGMVLGVHLGDTYDQETLRIAPGEVLVLFTDGVTDVFSARGEAFGEVGVREIVETFSDASPETICRRLWEATQAFAGGRELEDDFTALVIRVGALPREGIGDRES